MYSFTKEIGGLIFLPFPMQKSPVVIRVGGVPEHFNLPWRLALEGGLFEKKGLDVRYQDYPGGTGALTQALREGSLDVAVVLTEGIVANILAGNTHRIVKVYVGSPLVWGIHVPAGSDILTEADLPGRRVVISRRGSGSHLMALVHAAQKGHTLSDGQFEVAGNLDGAREAMKQGRGEVFFWERYMTQPLVTSGEFRRVGELVAPWPSFVIAARKESIIQYPDALREMLELVDYQAERIMNNPAAAGIVAGRYGLDRGQAAEWLAITRWNMNFDEPAEALASVIAALQQVGLVQQLPTDSLWAELS
ncbi:MAG: ABC transporter substrate-binding protein [Bacteroidetes bacterium]|nr:MAG: ABC transporter substrate-binding protein [Bacteroidota bacterium]